MRNKTYNKRKLVIVFLCALIFMMILIGRLIYLMLFEAEYYQAKAEQLHKREREIKAARGNIIDRNGEILATNKAVCTVSVIHSQITDAEEVITQLSEHLNMDTEIIREKVEKVSSREKIKSNVEKTVGDLIRNLQLDGVKVDEDFKRFYPHENIAAKVLGFTGADNQGIIGLEVRYEEWLKGINGMILTTTDARGVELEGIAEDRMEPVAGKTLQLTLDYNIQNYVQQTAEKVRQEKNAEAVVIIVMNPKNGEIYACTDTPEFNLNEPFTLIDDNKNITDDERQNLLNQMWRNRSINDTYEPGSIFKVVTASAALEECVVDIEDTFFCPGYKIVEDRRIRCAKVGGHGSESFAVGLQNSCNPVFIEVGARLGVRRFYDYIKQFCLLEKTGVDLPGEAGTIIHKIENVGQVELATMSFGQSFQITPMQMITTVSSIINGGKKIVPHFGRCILDENGKAIKRFSYESKKQIVSKEVSDIMRLLLESVVDEGGGKNAYIEGYRIGGKTATSQTLPRSARKYISSFVGFAPANNPQVVGMAIIYNPQGIYYGGIIAAPVIRDIFDNILPYLGIDKENKALSVEK